MAKIAVLHGNEGGHPTRPVTVPNYVAGGPVFSNRGGNNTQQGGQYWFDNTPQMPFGKGMQMESSGSSPCAIASDTTIVVSGPFKHKIWIDRLDDSHRVLWSMGTNGREDGTQYAGIRGRPQGGGLFKLDFFGRDSGVGATIALSPSFAFPSSSGTVPRLFVTERDSAGYIKLSLDGELLVTSSVPWTPTLTGYLSIFGLYDRVNQSSDGVYRASTGEMEFTVDESDLVYPFAVPTERFSAGSVDVTVGLTGAGGTAEQATFGSAADTGLTSNAATSAPGTITQSRTRPLTNALTTAGIGTLARSNAVAFAGNTSTAELGQVSAGSDVTAALVGLEATGAPGAVSASGTSEIVVALAGAEATAQAGQAASGVTLGVAGSGATAQQGDSGEAIARDLTGATAAAAMGDTVHARDTTLPGAQATSAAGIVAAASGQTISGNGANATAGTVNAGSDVTVLLTGAGAAASAGALAGQVDRLLSGEEAVTAFGDVGRGLVFGLSGVEAVAESGSASTETPPTGWLRGSVGGETRAATIGAESRTWSMTR